MDNQNKRVGKVKNRACACAERDFLPTLTTRFTFHTTGRERAANLLPARSDKDGGGCGIGAAFRHRERKEEKKMGRESRRRLAGSKVHRLLRRRASGYSWAGRRRGGGGAHHREFLRLRSRSAGYWIIDGRCDLWGIRGQVSTIQYPLAATSRGDLLSGSTACRLCSPKTILLLPLDLVLCNCQPSKTACGVVSLLS